MRTGEGYLAEVVDAPDGDGLLLIEHHCPICDAAKACTNLCSAELDLFRDVLGPDVEVIRTQHLSRATSAAPTACGPRVTRA